MIYNNSYIPNTNDGFPISSGGRTSIEIKRNDFLRLGEPFNNCVKTGDKSDSDLYNYILQAGETYSQKCVVFFLIVSRNFLIKFYY